MNIFTGAALAPVKTTAAKAADKRVKINIPGIGDYAAYDTAEKSIKGLKEAARGTIDTAVYDHFVKQGLVLKRAPDTSIDALDTDASAVISVKIRSSASVLKDDEIELLARHNIPTVEKEIVPTTFIVNPIYAEDLELLGRISAAVAKTKDVPTDLFLRQENKKQIVDQTSLDAIFTKTPAVARQLLPVVTTVAIKPKYEAAVIEAIRVLASKFGAKLVALVKK